MTQLATTTSYTTQSFTMLHEPFTICVKVIGSFVFSERSFLSETSCTKSAEHTFEELKSFFNKDEIIIKSLTGECIDNDLCQKFIELSGHAESVTAIEL